MGEPYGGLPDLSAEELKREFPFDARPVHPEPEEPHPLENLAGRGQTEWNPMGLGLTLSSLALCAFLLFVLVLVAGYLFSLIH